MKTKKYLLISVIIVLLIASYITYYEHNMITKKIETQVVNTSNNYFAQNTNTQDSFPSGEKDYTKDFNFDGMNDLSIHTSNSGGYGGPTYAVYLYDSKTSKYIYNKEISELISMQGMFDLDKTKKIITIYTKDGCCSHTTEEYQVNSDNSLKKVYTKTEKC